MSPILKLGASAALTVAASAASAGPIYSASSFAPTDTTITFSEVAVTNNSAVNTQFSGFGVEFGKSGGTVTWKMASSTLIGGANFSGKFLFSQGATNNSSSNYLNILFGSDVDAAGGFFEFNASASPITIAAYSNNVLVEALNYTNNNCCATSAFLGFNNIVFDELRISNLKDRTFYLHGLTFSGVNAVPEPGSLALAGLVMGGLFTTRKRWKR